MQHRARAIPCLVTPYGLLCHIAAPGTWRASSNQPSPFSKKTYVRRFVADRSKSDIPVRGCAQRPNPGAYRLPGHAGGCNGGIPVFPSLCGVVSGRRVGVRIQRTATMAKAACRRAGRCPATRRSPQSRLLRPFPVWACAVTAGRYGSRRQERAGRLVPAAG